MIKVILWDIDGTLLDFRQNAMLWKSVLSCLALEYAVRKDGAVIRKSTIVIGNV